MKINQKTELNKHFIQNLIFRVISVVYREGLSPKQVCKLIRSRPFIQGISLLILGLLVVGCTPSSSSSSSSVSSQVDSKKLGYVTSFYPLAFILQTLTQDIPEMSVQNLTPQGEDPAIWTPSPSVLQKYQKATFIFLNGAHFEQWVDHVSLPLSRTIYTARAFKKEWVNYDHAVVHKHGPEGEHSHQGLDGHTWLDPLNLLAQGEVIYQKIYTQASQAQRLLIKKRWSSLKANLQDLHKRWLTLAPKLSTFLIVASHPAYNYLRKRYQLNLVSLDFDPDTPLTLTQLKTIQAQQDKHPHLKSLMVWWESQPHPKTQTLLTQAHLPSFVISPLESSPSPSDYLQASHALINLLQKYVDSSKTSLPSPEHQ